MKNVEISKMPNIVVTDELEIMGHTVYVNEREYFIVPTPKSIMSFEIKDRTMERVGMLTMTDEILEDTKTVDDFMEFIANTIVPFLEG